ncbi:MAG: hypothetical protein VZR10_08020 [Methanobrevibacter sp.]|nr:hypothetical protein [Methanobrevibacter sp.]
MKVEIKIILNADEYLELKKECDNARDCIVANGKISGVKIDGLLEACTPDRILERFKESFESEMTLDDAVKELIYESLG